MYYNASGGCFEGNCVVRMLNGEMKKIRELKKGDRVLNNYIVKALIKIKTVNDKMIELVRLDGGLLITPKHPVLKNN